MIIRYCNDVFFFKLAQVYVFHHKGCRSLKKTSCQKPGHSYRFRTPAQVEIFGFKGGRVGGGKGMCDGSNMSMCVCVCV